MVFNSVVFFVTLAAVYPIYLALHRDWRFAKGVLIAYSFFFYGLWSLKFLGIMIATSSVDYVAARLMRRFSEFRRLFLTISIVCGLGLLAYFKYINFAVENANGLAALLGVQLDWPTVNVLLPIGISFYTFHSLSYSIDVYRGKLEPISSYSDYVLFVSFFPCLVAGPIIRATDFLHQLKEPRRPDERDFLVGMTAVAFGLFLKCGVADNVGPYVNQLFDRHASNGIFENWLAATLFGVQIFADFAGYSGIAIGLARMLGFWIPRNFNSPYAATGFSDFWRRWHISLSTWFRDYLYIPLGGNRVGPARMAANLTLTMFLCGLWHGASVLFITWGLLHGAFLAIEHATRAGWRRFATVSSPNVELRPASSGALHELPLQIVTFLVVSAAWLCFRAKSVDQFLTMSKGLVYGPPMTGTVPAWLGLIVIGVFGAHLVQRRFDVLGRIESSSPLCAITICLGFYAVAVIGAAGQDFIYFRF